MNNMIYGMTGGQGSPTTPVGAISTTTPYGSGEAAFDLCGLAAAAGANYAARWTSYHVKELTHAVRAGLESPGFSFIEVLVQCPTNYGRRNKFREVMNQIDYFKSHAMLVQKADRMRNEGKTIPDDMFIVGEIAKRDRPALGVPR
jgi:2-oxoglutarate ferredoxin oxidoreductase subunit beta